MKILNFCLHYSFNYIYRAIAKARLGEINSAFDDINYCIDILPMGQLFFYRGYLFWGYTENYDSAISDFLRAIEYDNKNGEYFYHLGLAKEKIGELKGACDDWEKAVKLGYEDLYDMIEKCN